jgi:hypothetical protein
VFYGIGDLGNAVVNSAIQFFLMKFYTDAALVLRRWPAMPCWLARYGMRLMTRLFGWRSPTGRNLALESGAFS